VEICDALEAAHGARFKAPDLLRDIAAKGDGFYARFGGGQAARAA
jgi:3-hydroxyacyl-CoA dehydrogenase/enoyl-CoA hydratase/3-hydroxybutyryl-CoA epimerase